MPLYVRPQANRALLYLFGFLMGVAPSLGPGVLGVAPEIVVLILVVRELSDCSPWTLKRVPIRAAAAMTGATCLIVFGFALSAFFSMHQDLGRFAVIAGSYTFVLLILPLFLVGLCSPFRNEMVRGYVCGVAAFIAISFLVYVFGFDFAKSHGLVTANDRLQMWMHPNHFPMHLILGMLVMAAEVLRSRKGYLPFAVFFVLGTACILFAGSSGPLVILFAGIAMFLLATRPKVALASGVILAGVVAILLVRFQTLVGDFDVLQRYSWVLSGDVTQAGSYELRRVSRQASLREIAESPVIGLGPGMGATILHSSPDEELAAVHNSFILIWLEGGVIAGIGGVAWFAAAAYWALRLGWKQGRFALISLALVALYWMTRTHGYQAWSIVPIAFFLDGGNGARLLTRRDASAAGSDRIERSRPRHPSLP